MPTLYQTTPRYLSNKLRRQLVSHPKQSGEKLTNTGFGIYAKKNFSLDPYSLEKPSTTFHKLRKKFSNLSITERSKYQKIAETNQKELKRRRDVLKATKTSGLTLFIREEYKKVSDGIDGDRQNKFRTAMKVIQERWKGLGHDGQEKYSAEASRIREDAILERDRMIARYQENY